MVKISKLMATSFGSLQNKVEKFLKVSQFLLNKKGWPSISVQENAILGCKKLPARRLQY